MSDSTGVKNPIETPVEVDDESKKSSKTVNKENKKSEYIDGPLTEFGQKAIDENGAIVELIYEVENTIDEMESTFYGKVKKEKYLSVPFQGDPKELENIRLVIGSSYNSDDYRDITKEKQATYEFD